MAVTMSAYRRAQGVVLALLLAVCAVGASSGESESMSGFWEWIPDFIRLECQSSDEELEEFDIPYFNRTELELTQPEINLTILGAELELYKCPLPRGSLADLLVTLQYPIAELQQLDLSELSPYHSLRAELFAGLNLRKIEINFDIDITGNLPHLNPDIFSTLAELTELDVGGAILTPMPLTSRLRKVSLQRGQSTGAWGGCAELRELTLINWEVPDAWGDEGWLTYCPQLSTLRLQRLSVASLLRVLRDTRALTSLQIRSEANLSLMQLNLMFSGLRLIKQLDVPYEMFQVIPEYILSTSLENLTLYKAHWSSNADENNRVVRRLERLPALRDLVLDYSSKSDFCKLFPEEGSLPELRRLSLSETTSEKLCFSGWTSLEYLDLSDSEIRELELVQLPPARAHPLVVDLSGAAVRDIPLDEIGYSLLLNKFHEGANVTIQGEFDLNCDCEHGWVARTLSTLPLSIPGARCKDYGGVSISDVSVVRLECDKFECGQCTCRRAWRDNTTTATCGRDATQVPRAPGLRALHAVGTYIDRLHTDDLPDTLLTLNLINSKISRLDQSVVDALFNVSARVMWLSGSPLACDCAARPLLVALQRQRAQVWDFDDVTCADGRALHALDVDALCPA